MKYECKFGNSDEVQKKFLELPPRLYDRKTYVQNIESERQLLSGTHLLSHYFSITPIIVVDQQNETLCRCMLTFYEADPAVYVGFFESIDDSEAAAVLFGTVEELARQSGRTKLVGPLNASFWIGYRFKINHFDSVYTAEPYNKEYYSKLWTEQGFKVCEKYFSNAIRVPKEEDSSMKCRQRLAMFREKGYVFQSPSKDTFDNCLKEIYWLMINVYAGFPLFKRIEEEEFCGLFGSLKQVLDFDFVKLVYKDHKLAGFFVCIPDYHNLTHQNVTLGSLLKILKIKISREKRYILLYMGISPLHPGLGSALAELVKQELTIKQAHSVAALIHEGKISGGYYKELATDRYEYVLMEKNLYS